MQLQKQCFEHIETRVQAHFSTADLMFGPLLSILMGTEKRKTPNPCSWLILLFWDFQEFSLKYFFVLYDEL